jgi:hypothetical protein
LIISEEIMQREERILARRKSHSLRKLKKIRLIKWLIRRSKLVLSN